MLSQWTFNLIYYAAENKIEPCQFSLSSMISEYKLIRETGGLNCVRCWTWHPHLDSLSCVWGEFSHSGSGDLVAYRLYISSRMGWEPVSGEIWPSDNWTVGLMCLLLEVFEDVGSLESCWNGLFVWPKTCFSSPLPLSLGLGSCLWLTGRQSFPLLR